MANLGIKIFVSSIAVALLVARWIWPELKVDAITLGLFIAALLPWLTSLIESLKTPGGWEVKLRDVKKASEQVAGTSTRATDEAVTHSFLAVADQDPNLALVGLRIEIEKRLRRIAEQHDFAPNLSLSVLIREMMKQHILPAEVGGGLQELIMAGNQAAHGARVEPALSDWTFSQGSAVLSVLDELGDLR